MAELAPSLAHFYHAGDRFLKTDRRGKLLSEIAKALEIEARPDAEIVESHLGQHSPPGAHPCFHLPKIVVL